VEHTGAAREDGQVLYARREQDDEFVVDHNLELEGVWWSVAAAPRYIRRNGVWCALNIDPSLLGRPNEAKSADYFSWLNIGDVTDDEELRQLEAQAKVNDSHIGRNLVQLYCAKPREIVAELDPVAPAPAWQSITCCASFAGKSHWGVIREFQRTGWAVAIVVDGNVTDAHYPSRWPLPETGRRRPSQETERETQLASMLQPLVKDYESLALPYLHRLEADIPKELYAYHDELKETIRKVAAFVSNSPRRAIKYATDALHMWVKGYYADLSSGVAAAQFERSVMDQYARASAKVEYAIAVSTRIALARKEALDAPGRTVRDSLVTRHYKLSKVDLARLVADGKLKPIKTQSFKEWSLAAIHEASRFSHLQIQTEAEIPKVEVTNLSVFSAMIDDMVSRLGPLSEIDIKSAIVVGDRLFSGGRRYVYEAHEFLTQIPRRSSFSSSATSPKPKVNVGRHGQADKSGHTTQPTIAVLQARKAMPPVTKSSARRIRVFTSGLGSDGLADFNHTLPRLLAPADLPTIEPVSIGVRDDAIIRAIRKETWRAGDILCLVRGGGDMLNETFRPYHSFDAALALQALVKTGVVVVNGIGHANDRFVVDHGASFVEITPTQAAHRVAQILTGS